MPAYPHHADTEAVMGDPKPEYQNEDQAQRKRNYPRAEDERDVNGANGPASKSDAEQAKVPSDRYMQNPAAYPVQGPGATRTSRDA